LSTHLLVRLAHHHHSHNIHQTKAVLTACRSACIPRMPAHLPACLPAAVDFAMQGE
jgi:hypothetical protein